MTIFKDIEKLDSEGVLLAFEQLREGWDFEAKKATGRDGAGALPNSFWETYSAMANTEGGFIALGVEEKSNNSFNIVGIKHPEEVYRQIFDQVSNTSIVNFNLLTQNSIKTIRYKSRQVILVEIRRAESAEKPIYVGTDPFSKQKKKGTFVRIHEKDQHASSTAVRQMFTYSHRTSDSQIVPQYNLDDLHIDSIKKYRNILSASSPDHPTLSDDIDIFLTKIDVLKKDRAHGTYGVTLAGLLMLGKESSIKEYLPHYHLSFIHEKKPLKSGYGWIDRVHSDGTWNANILQFYLRVMPKVLEELKVPFNMDQNLFRQDDTSVHKALREAVINTLSHADYGGQTSIRIFKRPDGFEFVNPGILQLAPERIWDGGNSQPTNPLLHRLFMHLKLSERAGFGGARIRKAWADQHWRAPEFKIDRELGETSLRLSHESLLPPEALRKAETSFPDAFEKLEGPERVALVAFMDDETRTHEDICTLTGLDGRAATLLLQKLQQYGVIKRSAGKYSKSAPYSLVKLQPQANTSPADYAESPADYAASPADYAASPADYAASPAESSLSQGELLLHTSSAEARDWHAHPDIVKVRNAGRIDTESMKRAILAACQDEARSLADLAKGLKRNASTLRPHLKTLLQKKMLVPLHPQLSHPDQRYSTISLSLHPTGGKIKDERR